MRAMILILMVAASQGATYTRWEEHWLGPAAVLLFGLALLESLYSQEFLLVVGLCAAGIAMALWFAEPMQAQTVATWKSVALICCAVLATIVFVPAARKEFFSNLRPGPRKPSGHSAAPAS